MKHFLIVFLVPFFASFTAFAQGEYNKAVHIWRTVDADTWQVSNCTAQDSNFVCSPFSGAYFIRLFGLDAPETRTAYVNRAQPYGPESAALVRQILTGKTVWIDSIGKDQYDRVIARIRLPDGSDLSKFAASMGWGWSYFPNYPKNPTEKLKTYRAEVELLQKLAKDEKMGLWMKSRPKSPSWWRRNNPGFGG